MMTSYRTKIFYCVLLVSLMLGVGFTASAQDSAGSPLLDMLARVPNTPVSRNEIYFNDRVAIEAAYPPARRLLSWAEFDSLDAGSDFDAEVWWRVWMNQSSAPTARYLVTYNETPDLLGFDYFDITQELSYGIPPNQTLQVAGSFDLDSVRTAFGAQGFEQDSSASIELWCGPSGCDSGLEQNLRERNPANMFGGDLGRKWPLIIQEGVLISSPSLPVIEHHLAVLDGQNMSLADSIEYRAAAETITRQGALLQAYFMGGESLLMMSDNGVVTALLGTQASPDAVREVLQRLLEDFETLPAYELLTIADVATETEQIGQVALVYSSAENAQIAADLIPRRIAAYQSLVTNRSLSEMLQERYVEEVGTEIVEHPETGKWVLVISFATPKASAEQIIELRSDNTEAPEVTPPGIIFRMLMQAINSRDTGWLNTATREQIEELIGS